MSLIRSSSAVLPKKTYSPSCALWLIMLMIIILLTKKYTDGINIEYSDPVIDRIPFTEQEIATLWSMSDDWDVKVLLILLYSGMRVNELLKNYRDNVNLEDHWIYVPAELYQE